MKTIDEALDYLYSFINYETDSSYTYDLIHYNVDRTVKLLDLLKNPEKSSQIIHVAGTKGKGSVCHILGSLLRVQNLSTGLFTSPHIMRVNERIAVNGLEIEDDEFIKITNKFPAIIKNFSSDNLPTTFEIFTAMAMYYFNMKKVSYSILETGMGGRFDSTNFSDPAISIITSVSYDHMDKLGVHIEEIAFEKAGIIKKNRPVVIGYQRYNVSDIFKRRSGEEESPCYMAEDLCDYQIENISLEGTKFSTSIDGLYLKDLFLSLPGKHQVENAVSALLSLKILNLLPDEDGIRDALKNVYLHTRLELIERKRRFLLDSAHNEDSARLLTEAVNDAYSRDRLITIVGIVKGKDVYGILRNLTSISNILIVTEPITPKELDTEYVFRVSRELFPEAFLIKNVYEAISYAEKLSKKEDLILITGSFYTTSPARSFIEQMPNI